MCVWRCGRRHNLALYFYWLRHAIKCVLQKSRLHLNNRLFWNCPITKLFIGQIYFKKLFPNLFAWRHRHILSQINLSQVSYSKHWIFTEHMSLCNLHSSKKCMIEFHLIVQVTSESDISLCVFLLFPVLINRETKALIFNFKCRKKPQVFSNQIL